MKTLILGGIKSGKSRLAEEFAAESTLPVSVIATARADDAEMSQRIRKHRQDRPAHWQSVEEPLLLGAALQALSGSGHYVIIDCVTLWLTNLLMLREPKRLSTEQEKFLVAVRQHHGGLAIVTNETSMGIVPLGHLSRRFCDEAGLLHQALAGHCDRVILTVAGLPHVLKGSMS